jgi:DnaJ domain
MSSDPLGYYSDLGVSHTASLDEIRAVYRALAKIYHPDVNRDHAAVQKFRRIAEAYETIGNPANRLSYDQSAAPPQAAKSDSDAPSRREPVEPIKCSQCEKVTAQPRFLVFRQVISYVFMTQTSPKPGIYCSDCAVKQGLKSSAISALFGWWGVPWGPIYTIREIIRNAFGGERRLDVDEQLIWQNSVAFMDVGKYDLAGSLARQLTSAKNAKIAESARQLLQILESSGQKIGQLKSPWKLTVGGVAGQLSMGFAIPAVAFVIFGNPFGDDSRDNSQTPIRPPQTIMSKQPAPTPAAVAPINLCKTLPRNGQVLQQKIRLVENGHRLTIINGSSGDAIAKLRYGKNRKLAASFYVTQNATASFEHIPDGSYTVQFAYGQAMTKDCTSFIENIANEFEGTKFLRTEVTSTQIITQELSFTLYTVAGGNIRPVGISSAAFDAP